MVRRVARFDIRKLMFLVHIDQRLPINRFVQPGAVHFAGLEHDVPIREENRRSPLFDPFNDVERVGEQAIGKRIIDQKTRNGEHVQVAWMIASVLLQRA